MLDISILFLRIFLRGGGAKFNFAPGRQLPSLRHCMDARKWRGKSMRLPPPWKKIDVRVEVYFLFMGARSPGLECLKFSPCDGPLFSLWQPFLPCDVFFLWGRGAFFSLPPPYKKCCGRPYKLLLELEGS